MSEDYSVYSIDVLRIKKRDIKRAIYKKEMEVMNREREEAAYELYKFLIAKSIESCECIEKIYTRETDPKERYREVCIKIPKMTEDIPCDIDGCEYNMQEYYKKEFNGTMYELIFNEGWKVCDRCWRNNDLLPMTRSCYYVDFDEVYKKYNARYLEESKANMRS
jgi:hypothetical protein